MSKGQKKEEYNVTVLSRREVTIYPRIGVEVPVIQVTYVAAGLPPFTVEIEKAKYSLELEKRLVRESIEKRLLEKPETYTV